MDQHKASKEDEEHKAFFIGQQGDKEGEFFFPSAVCFTKKDEIVVTDTSNHRLQVFSPQGTFLRALGRRGVNAGQFNLPYTLCMGKNQHDDLICVADTGNNRLQVLDLHGNHIRSIPCPGPRGVCVDKDNTIFTTSWINFNQAQEDFQIRVFSWEGEPIRTFCKKGDAPGDLNRPEHLCFSDDLNQLFVADSVNHRIQVFTPEGHLVRAFGSKGTANLQFNMPSGVCLDTTGTLIIADYNNHRLVSYRWDGEVETFLQATGKKGQGQGEFNRPCGLCVDSRNRLAVADHYNDRIQVLPCVGGVMTKLWMLCCLLLP